MEKIYKTQFGEAEIQGEIQMGRGVVPRPSHLYDSVGFASPPLVSPELRHWARHFRFCLGGAAAPQNTP